MWLVRTLFAPLASFCRWLFLKNIFGLMSSTVGIAVSVIVPSIWGEGGGRGCFKGFKGFYFDGYFNVGMEGREVLR